MLRQVVLDTETTGLNPATGDRIIEVGAIELVDRKPTGNTLHYYINPDSTVAEEALKVHGLSNEFLNDKPRFFEVADEIMTFIMGAELIIHNAEFDLGFLNYELSFLRRNPYGTINDHCDVIDSLAVARKLHPGQRNSLDALCKRYNIKNSHRTFHGALLDAEILAQVYITMTGGQEQLFTTQQQDEEEVPLFNSEHKVIPKTLRIVRATEAELQAHEHYFG